MDWVTLLCEFLGLIVPILVLIVQTTQKNQSNKIFNVYGCLNERHYREYILLNRYWYIFYFSGYLINIARGLLIKYTNSTQITKEFLSDTNMVVIVLSLIIIILASKRRKPINFLLKGMDTFSDIFYVAIALCIIVYSIISVTFDKNNPKETISLIFSINIIADSMIIGSCVFLYYRNYYWNTFVRKADSIKVVLIDGQVIEGVEGIGISGNYIILTPKVDSYYEKYIVLNSNIKYLKKSFKKPEDSN